MTSPWLTLLPWRRLPLERRHEIPVNHVGLLSFLFYSWLDSIMWRMFRHPDYDPIDRSQCPDLEKASANADRVEKLWREEVCRVGLEKASMSTVILRFVRLRTVVACVVVTTSVALVLFSVAYVLMMVLSITADKDAAVWKVLVLVFALFAINVLATAAFVAGSTIGLIAGSRLRAGVLFLLYRKILQTTSLRDETVGKVLNLYSSDGQRLLEGACMLPNLISGPLFAVGATAFAISLIGAWALIGFVILMLMLPVQIFTGKLFMKFRANAVVITDQRVHTMNEYLANIRFIKMYSWEKPLSKFIATVRAAEQRILERFNITASLAFMSSALIVSTATMLTLIAYTSAGNPLSPVQGFIYLLIYTSIQDKLQFCMLCLKHVTDMFVAAGRFQDVFATEELRTDVTSSQYRRLEKSFMAIDMRNAVFEWPYRAQAVDSIDQKEQEHSKWQHKLKNREQSAKSAGLQNFKADAGNSSGREVVMTSLLEDGQNHTVTSVSPSFSFKIEKGKLVGIAGPFSSGKTSLIRALLGQMKIVSGEILVAGRLAYVPQQPWIINASLRDNILLGSEVDQDRYPAVVEACCLDVDVAALSDGHSTMIGDRGVTLSGGQRQRVSLARAVYSDRDIYLLDDPLAAVDPDVALTVFRRVVLDLLVGKTVILVTHQLQFLSSCDYVIYVPGGGRSPECGSHEQLMELTGGEYATVVSNALRQQQQQQQQQQTKRLTAVPSKDGDDNDAVDTDDVTVKFLRPAKPEISLPVRSPSKSKAEDRHRSSLLSDVDASTNDVKPPGTSTVTADRWVPDESRQGTVSLRTYAAYISAAGGVVAVVAVLFASIIAEGVKAFSFWWLAYWLDQGSGSANTTLENVDDGSGGSGSISDNPLLWMYNLVYGMSLVAIFLFFTARSFIFVKLLMRASSRLHDWLFSAVMRAPVSFFDLTPRGRIVSRFSRDMDEMDARLPMLADNTLRTLLNIAIYVILIAVILPWFLLLIPVASAAFVLVYIVFRVGIQRLQRFQLESMAPLLTHVDASVHGLASVHAYERVDDFQSRFEALLNASTARLLMCKFAQRWTNMRLCIVTSSIVSCIALIIFVLRDVVPTSYAGAALIYAFQLLSLFQLFVTFAVDTEATFTSTERIRFYIKNLPQEGALVAKTFGISDQWPETGQIQFVDFRLRYGAHLPYVLNGMTFDVRAKEKVGIVGRTGSGKSSLVAALFRLTEKCGGRIDIDGIDVSRVGLEQLRTRLSIITQDPVLFSGTIRSNLDPFGRHIDRDLWTALEKCHIKGMVSSLNGQLTAQVLENGENFSAGERQLLCLARVLLRHSRIVVLDEATSSLDSETAARIHDTIRQTFSDCTLIIIAHSMCTVLQCDRILVINAGQVVEYDRPSVLLENHDSAFSRLMEASQVDDATDNSAVVHQTADSLPSTTASV